MPHNYRTYWATKACCVLPCCCRCATDRGMCCLCVCSSGSCQTLTTPSLLTPHLSTRQLHKPFDVALVTISWSAKHLSSSIIYLAFIYLERSLMWGFKHKGSDDVQLLRQMLQHCLRFSAPLMWISKKNTKRLKHPCGLEIGVTRIM